MHISAIIPTRNRAHQLRSSLDRLARQDFDRDRFEVVVALDGPDSESSAVVAGFSGRLNFQLITAERLGIAHVKNEAIKAARGSLLVLLNDDVLPDSNFLAEHAAAHARPRAARNALIVGHSPFLVSEDATPTVFDEVMRRTSMVFFYDRMIDEQGRATKPFEHDWGFRHAWNLNLSLRKDVAELVGGFNPAIANCCYEDIEFAWRAARIAGAAVLFHPGARAPHDHRYTPRAYLDREWRLGYSAFGFAEASPDCAHEVFRADLRSEAERAFAHRFVEREAGTAGDSAGAFDSLASLPAATLRPDQALTLARAGFAAGLMARRMAFFRGFLAACAGERVEGLFLPPNALGCRSGSWPAAPGRKNA